MIYRVFVLLMALMACAFSGSAAPAAEPVLFTGNESRPADAVNLFDGKDLSEWVQCGSDNPASWKVENGYMQVRGGNICTKRKFSDVQLHVEFWLPLMADAQGQARANSGVYLAPWCEVQLLDSYGLKSGAGDCGAIYGIAPPIVNANRPPEQWQTYDIVFHGARYDGAGKKVANSRITVFQNGVLIQDNVEVPSPDTADPGERVSKTSIMLQDHGCPLRFRNVWARQLPGK